MTYTTLDCRDGQHTACDACDCPCHSTIEGEFDEILLMVVPSRPLMSRPPQYQAAKKVIREVMDVTGITDVDKATEVADWLVNKMERYGARTAQLVFDVDGNGPKCSWCGAIWPLCGHHHMSEVTDTTNEATA